jgi:hypothetical protein
VHARVDVVGEITQFAPILHPFLRAIVVSYDAPRCGLGEAVHRGQIEELTHGVNNMLTLYLEVHNGMFAHPWWRSIPVPGLFKAIPYDRYEIQISKVEQILREIEGHERDLYAQAAPEEKSYVGALYQYTVALLKTVIALRPVVVGLKAKTDNKSYSMEEYKKNLTTYQGAEKGYHVLGEEMNRQWREYQRSFMAPARAATESCRVHILDPMHGLRVETWVVGEQVKRETYNKFKDQNGNIYMVVAYEKGEPNTMVVAKSMWVQVAQQFADIDLETAAALEKMKLKFGLK